MKLGLTPEQEASEDLRYGQIVIVIARWFIVAVAMFMTMYRGGPGVNLPLNFTVIWIITLYNAFIHARVYLGRPLGRTPVLLASIADILIITAIVATSPHAFGTNVYVYYYAAIVGFSLVFDPRHTLALTAGAMLLYTFFSLIDPPGVDLSNYEEKTLILRLVIMAAIATMGTMFFRIERRRRFDVVQSQIALLQESPTAPQPPGSAG